MPKTEQDLQVSRENRERIITDLGCVPESILVHDKSDKAIDLMVERNGGGYGDSVMYPHHAEAIRNAPHLAKAFAVNNLGVHKGALSRFPQNIGRIFLKLYTKPGDTVVDPFAGHNSRMEMCWRCNRNYIGNDISAAFMIENRKIAAMLAEEATRDMFANEHLTAWIQLHEGDSRAFPCADNIGDFTITSPPYWDIEDYGDEPGQLGKGKSYVQFLLGLGDVVKENFRVLKPGAFSIWCINDFRKGGRFYSYHEDMADLLRDAGFYQWDIAITDLGSSFGACFAQQVVERMILPKRHEYCLIYRKPE